MLTSKRLRLAGYFAIVNAFTSTLVTASLPITLILLSSFNIEEFKIRIVLILVCLLGICGEALTYVYVFFTLRLLIKEQCPRSQTSQFVTVFVLVNFLTALFSLGNSTSGGIAIALYSLSKFASFADLLTLLVFFNLLFFPLGITYAVFGIRLLSLPNSLYGIVKPFAYLTIATGACLSTIIFSPLSILTSMISEILLAYVFFRAAEKKNV